MKYLFGQCWRFRFRIAWSRNIAAILIFAFASFHSSSKADADDDAKSLYDLWYGRAVPSSVSAEDSLDSDEALTTLKWYSPLKVAAHFDNANAEQTQQLQDLLEKTLQVFIDTTSVTAAVVHKDDDISPNVIILMDDSVADAIRHNRALINKLKNDGGRTVSNGLADPENETANCGFNLGTKDHTEITKGIVYLPVAEDVFATEKCFGEEFYHVTGMIGRNITGESVVKRTDATILPTKEDRLGLKIHYIHEIQSQMPPSSIMSVIQSSKDQGSLNP